MDTIITISSLISKSATWEEGRWGVMTPKAEMAHAIIGDL